MATKSQIDILDSVDQDVLQSYAAYQAGVGPVADIMERIEELQPAERCMILDLWHRRYKQDGTPDMRRSVNKPPFDPPYTDTVAVAPKALMDDARSRVNGEVHQ